jgi:hypothetical protein
MVKKTNIQITTAYRGNIGCILWTKQDALSPFHQATMSAGLSDSVMDKNCELHWRLTMFFLDTGRNIIRRSQVRIIFQILFSIIEERQLASLDSADIFLCDKDFKQLLHMPHIHMSQFRVKIMAMLKLTNSGRRVSNATDYYKNMVRRIFPQQQPTRNNQRHPVPPVQLSPQRILWTMEAPLSSLLIGFVSLQPVEFRYILNLVMLYIAEHRNRLCHPLNLEIACIRDDELFQIFGVSFIHCSQLRGIVRDHVTPIEVDHIVVE